MSLIYSTSTASGRKASNLYIGGKDEAKDKKFLQRCGITHILNATPMKQTNIKAGVPNYFENNPKMKIKYKRIPLLDAPTSNLLEYADAAVQFISSGLHHGSVLVHCQRGVSRSVSFVSFFLMRHKSLKMSMDDAMKMIKEKRSIANPIDAFVEQIKQYEKKCNKIHGNHKHKSSTISTKTFSTSESNEKRARENFGDNGEHSFKKRQIVIGPTMPSSLRKANDRPHKKVETENVLIKQKRPPIGPAMPPDWEK